MDQYLAPALGALILLGLTVLIAQMREVNKNLTSQGNTLTKLTTVVGLDGNGLISRVNALESAAAREVERQLLSLRDERRHGLSDRRHETE